MCTVKYKIKIWQIVNKLANLNRHFVNVISSKQHLQAVSNDINKKVLLCSDLLAPLP
jgi:hypothetical protein